jgi:hypothetical protein
MAAPDSTSLVIVFAPLEGPAFGQHVSCLHAIEPSVQILGLRIEVGGVLGWARPVEEGYTFGAFFVFPPCRHDFSAFTPQFRRGEAATIMHALK